MDLLRKVSTKFISGLVKMLEDKNKRPHHILDNYESSFISHLVEIQEDKIHLAKWGYSGMFTRHILDNYESSFISLLVEAQEDKIHLAKWGYSGMFMRVKRFSPRRNVLDDLESRFISRLIKTQEDKIHFAKWRYSNLYVYFPSVICENGHSPLFRFKSVVYYELSKEAYASNEEIENVKDATFFYLIFRENIKEESLNEQAFDTIARENSGREYNENERFYLNIFYQFFSYMSADQPGFWEDTDLYSALEINGNYDGNKKFTDLRRRFDVGPFYYEDNFRSNSIIRKNNISTFREGECVICKDAVPNMLFPNCGHIIVCHECYSMVGFERKCPLCKIPIQLE